MKRFASIPKHSHDARPGLGGGSRVAVAVLLGALLVTGAQALEINVVGPDELPLPAAIGYRWVVQEDLTHQVEPGVTCMNGDPTNCHAVQFHRSYMPIMAIGDDTGQPTELPTDRHYYVSVLPSSGYTIGGAAVDAGQTTVTVRVNPFPIPTAQIRVYIFEDNWSINNAPDLPEEAGPAQNRAPLAGWEILLEDAGGRWGVSAGMVSQDAFGNPLDTTYWTQSACDADPVNCAADGGVGSVRQMGDGIITTGPDGVAVIKNLSPGKYGIQVVPPAGEGWQQTSTIEGKKVIDAWVKADEPSFFTEFGPPGPHVFIGYVKDGEKNPEYWTDPGGAPLLNGNGSIRGIVHKLHMSRPPDFAFHLGAEFGGCWVGLNEAAVGAGGQLVPGRGLWAEPCDADSSFHIDNVPAGTYQLVLFDANLNMIFGFHQVTVAETSPGVAEHLDVGPIATFPWFAQVESVVFSDDDQDGFRDPGEAGLVEQAVNIRWRDGTLYQSVPTDIFGEAPFEEVFPFFAWLVAEVDFARYKATGATFTVDAGGPIDPLVDETLNPQPQCSYLAGDPNPSGWDPVAGACLPGRELINANTGDNLSRTETGPVLTAALQTFLGQTNRIEWGKAPYGPNENGGISGIVYYAVTRAEDDPAYAAAEPWEPGVPRVPVNLYQSDRAGNITDLNGDGSLTKADVDNYPFGWIDDPAQRGPEDHDRNGNGVFNYGDAIQVTSTDSWDDSLPEGCQGETFRFDPTLDGLGNPIPGTGTPTDCLDGLRNFNQVRPGVFDGGYAFDSYFPGGGDSGSAEVAGLPKGYYVVEAVSPQAYRELPALTDSDYQPAYVHVREEDVNVHWGDEYTPSDLLLPPPCVGEPHLVPEDHTMWPLYDDAGNPLRPFRAGELAPLCDRKRVRLTTGVNAAADFFLFTEAPIAAQARGFILNDLANEFDPFAPTFGEKWSPPHVPVSIRDWTGKEISRVYGDRWGNYNFMAPSTFTANLPYPSGMSPNMLITCMNDPGPIPNPDYDPNAPAGGNNAEFITDPFFDRRFSQFCYTFQYMPGTTTYLDTPVVPIAAFAEPGNETLDCEFRDGTPLIYSVSGPAGGPYVEPGQTITLTSVGALDVPNPEFDGTSNFPRVITRDYGFGDVPGVVTLDGAPLPVGAWSNGSIDVLVPPGAASGQLAVVRSSGAFSHVGVHLTVGPLPPGRVVRHVAPDPLPNATPIQDAIDAANPGDLILVAPGNYNELVIQWKPVSLQGWGAFSTTINAAKTGGEMLQRWRADIDFLFDNQPGNCDFGAGPTSCVDTAPGQERGGPGPLQEQQLLLTEQGPAVIVLAKNVAEAAGGYGPGWNPRLDGFTLTGSDTAGGTVVNAFARDFVIGNNRVISNAGIYAGGIRSGNPFLTTDVAYSDSFNRRLRIHHNQVTQNGSFSGPGAGIALHKGTDGYNVTDNWICGNFGQREGGGIAHFGRSPGGTIARNFIIFNQTFNQGLTMHGGGVFIGGNAPLFDTVSEGSGSVTLDSNFIQGNQAGAGDGGGVRVAQASGQDIRLAPGDREAWDRIDIVNNFIVNNVSGLRGGGISLEDSAAVDIINNTIVYNDSTATASDAFAGPVVSDPQPGGLVSYVHTGGLAAEIDGGSPGAADYAVFSNPKLINNIIWRNRSFHYDANLPGGPGLLPDLAGGDPEEYWDLQVWPPGGGMAFDSRFNNLTLNPRNLAEGLCPLSVPPHPNNLCGDPVVLRHYANRSQGHTVLQQEQKTNLAVQPAPDEGGNFIDVHFGPLTLWDPLNSLLPFGVYFLQGCSPAKDAGTDVLSPFCGGFNPTSDELCHDIDGDPRPQPLTAIDIGADESNLFCLPGLGGPDITPEAGGGGGFGGGGGPGSFGAGNGGAGNDSGRSDPAGGAAAGEGETIEAADPPRVVEPPADRGAKDDWKTVKGEGR